MKQFIHFLSHVYNVSAGVREGAVIEHLHPTTWQPALDVYEQQDSIRIVVELPGIDKDQIHVRVEQGILRITGCRPKQIPETTQRVHQMEIPYGPFARLVTLPEGSDVERIEAKYENGYLIIEIPKARTPSA
jgi:HSP20 family protein